MAHAQKPDFVFPRNGRVHLNRWGRQFSRLMAAEVCASAVVMLNRPRSEVAWEYWLPTPFASFLFTSPPVRHRVPPGSERALPKFRGKRCLLSTRFRDVTSQNRAAFISTTGRYWNLTCAYSVSVLWGRNRFAAPKWIFSYMARGNTDVQWRVGLRHPTIFIHVYQHMII